MGNNYEPFSNPRWNQQLGAVLTGKKYKLTEKDKKQNEEDRKKWKETVKKLKEKRTNTK